jgi:pilus assembly protein CpaF
MVNPDASVWVAEDGRIRALPGIRFEEGALLTSLQAIANRFGKKLDADSPIMTTGGIRAAMRLPSGSRKYRFGQDHTAERAGRIHTLP